MINKRIQKIRPVVSRAKGFTLIETLIAVLILATAIVGPLTIASKGLQTALIAKNQAIADYLAQDAVEYVRFARDSNRLQGLDWLLGSGSGSTNLGACVSTDGTRACYLDSLGNSPSTPAICSAQGCGVMRYDTVNQYYNYAAISTTNPATPFTRTIVITTPACAPSPAPPNTNCNPDEATLSVTISWSDIPGVTHSVIVRESLLAWQ